MPFSTDDSAERLSGSSRQEKGGDFTSREEFYYVILLVVYCFLNPPEIEFHQNVFAVVAVEGRGPGAYLALSSGDSSGISCDTVVAYFNNRGIQLIVYLVFEISR
jgi:hypothetical protein